MGTGPSMLLFPCYAVTPIVPCYLLTGVSLEFKAYHSDLCQEKIMTRKKGANKYALCF